LPGLPALVDVTETDTSISSIPGSGRTRDTDKWPKSARRTLRRWKRKIWPAHVYRGGQTSFGLAVADFNQDGHPDIITANQDSDSASMFLNDGKGGFGLPAGEYTGYINGNHSSGPVNAPLTSFTPADVDGDGKN